MATYPANIANFGADRIDGTSPVVAADVNQLYGEVIAIETYLGTNPTIPEWTGAAFDSATASWSSIHERLKNIEKGVYVAFNDRVSKAGGTTIATSGTTVGLTLSTTGTGNLLSAGGGNTVINSSGYIVLIDGGTA